MRKVKQLDITIPKCDYLAIPFSIKKNNEKVELGEKDLLFFSVKIKDSDKEYVFQKTLNDGIIFDSEKNRYLIEIDYEDTKDLCIGTKLIYDITIYYNGTKPSQKVIGVLEIGRKVTLNEVI